jgi:Carboxypeptidase regulatory-like domain
MPARRKKMLLPCAVILLSGLVAIASESKVIRGAVTDEAGAAIPVTTIEISCSDNGLFTKTARTHSGEDGNFQLEATLGGLCKISFSATGFQPLEMAVRDSDIRSLLDVGFIRLKVGGCWNPGAICDSVIASKRRAWKCLYLWRCGY